MSVEVPDDICADIAESSNDWRVNWTTFYDRDGEAWRETDEHYDGDIVMLPCAGDMRPMLRRDVVAEYGPLVSEGSST